MTDAEAAGPETQDLMTAAEAAGLETQDLMTAVEAVGPVLSSLRLLHTLGATKAYRVLRGLHYLGV